ncbi:MAG: RNA polymerase sigma-70 factor [Muribaculaceae bacterium]|nr:RNA polymerase sigma-70 factor [Muribaculaceae bacterium]
MMTEKTLIERLRKADRRAFDAIYSLYAPHLLRFCLHHLDSPQDAEEVVQDVFVDLWRSREVIRATDSLRPLLFTSARFRILNRYRARVDAELLEEYRRATQGATARSAEFELEYRDLRLRVIKALRHLPHNQRRVIVLSRFRYMSNSEIATHLGLSLQTVKNTLSLALKNLRNLLDSHILTGALIFSGACSVLARHLCVI